MSPRGVVRRFPLLSFALLACLFGWSPYVASYLGAGSGGWNLPLGPILAVLVVVSCQGRQELGAWGRRLRNWRAAPGWYALALLAPLVLQVAIVVVNHGLGAPLPTTDQLADWPQVPVTFVIMLVFVGIGEEAGWVGFAAPVLLRRHGMLVAWLIASALRIVWHVPLMVDGELSWVLGTVGNAAFTMVSLQVLTASRGRWSLVAVWHAMLNAVGGAFLFTMVSGDDNARLGFLLAAAYTVVAAAAYFSAAGPRDPAGGRHDRSSAAERPERTVDA